MSNPYGHPKPQYEGLSQKEKQAAYSKACYEKHKEERKAYGRKQSKEYREKNSAIVLPKKRDQWLRVNFKRDTKWYEETLIAQGGHCSLCPATPEGRRLQVDHDHGCCPTERSGNRKTCGNCVRGLLCEDCNTRLGFLEILMADLRNPENGEVDLRNSLAEGSWTSRALQYLKRYQK